MRRALLSCTLVVLLLALPPALAQGAPAGDSVILTGAPADAPAFFRLLALEARSGPSGEQPTGQVRIDAFVTFRLGGPVTCLAVTGDTAIIGFRDELTTSQIITLRVVDGEPDTIDVISVVRSPTDCSPGVPTSSESFLQTGDLEVVDAAPLPTTKDQCKAGGWRAYGVFMNQGDCVSSVATGGRNGPAGL